MGTAVKGLGHLKASNVDKRLKGFVGPVIPWENKGQIIAHGHFVITISYYVMESTSSAFKVNSAHVKG